MGNQSHQVDDGVRIGEEQKRGVRQHKPLTRPVVLIALLIIVAVVVVNNSVVVGSISILQSRKAVEPAATIETIDQQEPETKPGVQQTQGANPTKVPQATPANKPTAATEPTVPPYLLVKPDGNIVVKQQAAYEIFKERMETHVVTPLMEGLTPPQSGIAVVDAINAIKFAPVNSNSPEDTRDKMSRGGELVKTLATGSSPEAKQAEAVRQAAYQEFEQSATKGLDISVNTFVELAEHANNMGYYFSGMWVLAKNQLEMAKIKPLVETAANILAKSYSGLADRQQASAKATASAYAQNQPSPQTQPNPQQNPAPQPQPQGQPQEVKVVLEAVPPATIEQGIINLPKTDYSKMPLSLPTPIEGMGGWSWSPDNLMLAFNQLKTWLSTGTISSARKWVVFSVRRSDVVLSQTIDLPKPVGVNIEATFWFFSLIREDTLREYWELLPETCQKYFHEAWQGNNALLAKDSRKKWGEESCDRFITGGSFRSGAKSTEYTENGQRHYGSHTDQNGEIDFLSTLWVSQGDLPFEAGDVVFVRSATNIAYDAVSIFK